MASGSDDLAGEYVPVYFTDDSPPGNLSTRELIGGLGRACGRALGPSSPQPLPPAPTTRATFTESPVFYSAIQLEPVGLQLALRSRWAAGAVTIRRRLQLQTPVGSAATGWVSAGRMRRFTPLYWIPVRVEMWSVGGGVVRVSMTPQRSVLASRRYFRLGHSVVDSLLVELRSVATSESCGPDLRRRRQTRRQRWTRGHAESVFRGPAPLPHG